MFRFSVTRFFYLLVVGVGTVLLFGCGPSKSKGTEGLASSVRARAGQVMGLKQSKRVVEDGKGYLKSLPGVYLEIPERRTVEEENFDREKIFSVLAKEYGVKKEVVEKVFAKKARQK